MSSKDGHVLCIFVKRNILQEEGFSGAFHPGPALQGIPNTDNIWTYKTIFCTVVQNGHFSFTYYSIIYTD